MRWGVILAGQRGLSIQGPHVTRAHKETTMNSRGCGVGPIEDAHVQGPEFCAVSLFVGTPVLTVLLSFYLCTSAILYLGNLFYLNPLVVFYG